MTIVKICGITNPEDGVNAAKAGADAIGFVFAQSPRRIGLERAKEISDRIKGMGVLKVGVFVNEDISRIKDISDGCGLDAIQLHGEESLDYCNKLLKISGNKKVIKAFRVKDSSVLSLIKGYRDVFAYLLDSYSQDARGGTGRVLDWDIALKVKDTGKPLILSGGLGPDNVEDAIRAVRPYGVDASSSIEIRPGIKDGRALQAFVRTAKSLD